MELSSKRVNSHRRCISAYQRHTIFLSVYQSSISPKCHHFVAVTDLFFKSFQMVSLVLVVSILVAEVSTHMTLSRILKVKFCRYQCTRKRNRCGKACFTNPVYVCEGLRKACLENCVMAEYVCFGVCRRRDYT